MVAGHLTLKNGKYYAVLNYKNAGGQRKTKWEGWPTQPTVPIKDC